jgi:Skp family chaperone for outer membrane proteins
MDRTSKSTAAVVLAMMAVFVGVIGVVAWFSLRGVAATPSDWRQASLAEDQKRLADEAAKIAKNVRDKIDKQERDAAAKADAERLERNEDDAKPRKEEVSLAAARQRDRDAEAERNEAAARTRETVAREKRRRGLLANRSIPAARFNPVMCAEKSAAAFEDSYFADAPEGKAAVHFFDVSTADGSLIVHLKREIVESPAETRRAATDAVVRAWRESKYTRRHGFSSAVEFRYGDSVLFTAKE